MDRNFPTEEALAEQGVTVKKQTPQQNQLSSFGNLAGLQDTGNKDIVSVLAGATGNTGSTTDPSALLQAAGGMPADQVKQAEDQKLQAIRDKLHQEQHDKTYFDPTFNKPPQQEESVAEKLEREEQEKEAKKMEELQEEEKKKPIAVGRAQTKAETQRGASG